MTHHMFGWPDVTDRAPKATIRVSLGRIGTKPSMKQKIVRIG